MFELTNLILLDLPNPTPSAPPGADKLTTVLGWVMWLVAALCLMMAIISGGRIAAAHRRGEEAEGFKGLAMSVIGFIVSVTAAAIMTYFS